MTPKTLLRTVAAAVLVCGSLHAADALDHRQLLWFHDASGVRQPVRTPADWARRCSDILRGMQQVMGELPDRRSLPKTPDMRVTETFQGEGYQRLSVNFDNLHGERVTAYLYIPDGIAPVEKRPGVLALQPTGKQGKEIADGRGPYKMNRAYALELARRGYIVISPDYPSFGEQVDYDFKTSRYASGTMKAISDNMRCIDLLQSRPEVDGEKIACIGHSLGGHNTLFTAAFDERIKVAVTSCGWTPFHYYYGGKKLVNWAQDRYMPRVRDVYESKPDKMPFDFQEVLGVIAPRAIYSNSPVSDANFEVEGVRVAVAEVKKVYDLLGVSDRLVVEYPDYAHDFQDSSRRNAYRFIDRQLGFTPVRDLP